MDREFITSRILNATPLQCVIITYEQIIESLQAALDSRDGASFKKHIKSAGAFLESLVESLNMDMDISFQLMSLYIYINKLIVTAEMKINLNKADEAFPIVEEARTIASSLYDAWKEIEKEDKAGIEKTSQQIFAGLTYKRGRLSEYVDEDQNRGFKA